jgi:hypothetical protein
METYVNILSGKDGRNAIITYKDHRICTRFTETEIKDLFANMLRDIELVDDKEIWKNSKHGYFTLSISFPAGNDLIIR